MSESKRSTVITFCVSRRRRKMYCGHARLCVCLSAAVRPHYCTDPDVAWGAWYRLPPSCALLGGFAIGARVALLWQHNANPSYKLASIQRYDDSANARLGGVGARRRPATGGRRGAPPKPCAAYGKRARPARRRPAADGGRSQHYCGSLECGLPLLAFWQQKANAKC